MRKSVKQIFKKLFYPLFIKLGYQESIPVPAESLLEHFFRTIKEMDFNPKFIVDVGSNHGNWTRQALRYFPDSKYMLLEPQQWLEKYVSDILKSNPNVKFYPVGAGSKNGSFKFTLLDRDDSSNFLMTEEEAKQLGLKQIEVEVVTLNEFVPKFTTDCPDIIKIDAEGLDLEVLEGASCFFGQTELFIVEAGVGSKYIENDIATVVNFMKQKGYRLFEVTDLNRPFSLGVLWLVELVFMRENGLIHAKVLELGID